MPGPLLERVSRVPRTPVDKARGLGVGGGREGAGLAGGGGGAEWGRRGSGVIQRARKDTSRAGKVVSRAVHTRTCCQTSLRSRLCALATEKPES